MADPDFNVSLQRLVSGEMTSARGDGDRFANLVEALINATAFSIAVGCNGNAEGMSTMLAGAEAHLNETAARHARMGELAAVICRDGGGGK